MLLHVCTFSHTHIRSYTHTFMHVKVNNRISKLLQIFGSRFLIPLFYFLYYREREATNLILKQPNPESMCKETTAVAYCSTPEGALACCNTRVPAVCLILCLLQSQLRFRYYPMGVAHVFSASFPLYRWNVSPNTAGNSNVRLLNWFSIYGDTGSWTTALDWHPPKASRTLAELGCRFHDPHSAPDSLMRENCAWQYS